MARKTKHFLRNEAGRLREIPVQAVYAAVQGEEAYAAIEIAVNQLGLGVKPSTLLEVGGSSDSGKSAFLRSPVWLLPTEEDSED